MQTKPVVDPATLMVSARWRRSLTVSTRGWQPGDYLFRLDASDGAQRYVPLTVRSARAEGTVTLLNAVTTWQAYNFWGGRSLYPGKHNDTPKRGYAVSFDRPYDADGSGEFFTRGEFGVVCLAESLGIPLSYATDLDLATDPNVLVGARAVVSLGHDEYYSPAMRAAVVAAEGKGVNLAVLGANAIFRRIRLSSSAYGPDRVEVNYRDPHVDPAFRRHDYADVTVNWGSAPDPHPEAEITGQRYDCDNRTPAAMRIVDAGSWLLHGTGSRAGMTLPNLVGYENDHVNLHYPTPRPLEILAHSRVLCHGPGPRVNWVSSSDMTYLTTRSGAAVFSTGTINWACSLTRTCTVPISPRVQQFVHIVTANVLRAFATGPLARRFPAHDNLNLIARRWT